MFILQPPIQRKCYVPSLLSMAERCFRPWLFSKVYLMVKLHSKKLGIYANCGHCGGQNAWMEKGIVHMWNDLILIPWRNTMVPRITTVLIVEGYHIYMMATIVNQIGLRVIHIPEGCTYFCITLMLESINWSQTECKEWEYWILEGKGIAK